MNTLTLPKSTTSSLQNPVSYALLSAFRAARLAWKQSWQQHHREVVRRATLLQLREMEDWQLADIGVERSDLYPPFPESKGNT